MKQQLTLLALTILSLVTGYRLPKNVMPENYRLEIITPFGEKDNFEFEGKVWIETSCVTPTTNITLHSKSLEIGENEVTLKDISSKVIKEIKGLKIQYDKDHDFLIILLDQPLTEDHRYEIYIPFKGKLDDGLAGFYRSSYIDSETKEKRWLGVTHFEATSARRAFPCFDEPEMKATFDISIARKEGYKSISNMPLLTTEPMKEKPGWYWDRFDISVPMSTYLVAYIVSDFEYKDGVPTEDHNNVTFRIWSRKDALGQVDFAAEVGPKALRFFEKFFGVDYPLPKQDMVAIPDFSAGAMENWGLITYRESYLLYDPKVSTKSSQHSVASVISHELAHQWFGNLVTMKWWTDIWLNEGFATYMASVAVDHLFPQWNSLQEVGASDMLNVFSFDALKSSHPVSVPIGDPREIEEIFDTISYKKGSSLIRMMSLFLGQDTLRTGVSKYLREHRYHNAEQDDLWKSLTETAHSHKTLPSNLTVKTIMDTWTLQTGYPVINVHRDYEKKSADITQERFLRDTIKLKDDSKPPCWWVPLSYSTELHPDFDETTPKYWLNCHDAGSSQTIEDIALENEWIIFNNKMAGIYRVNYDDKNWHMLAEALKSDYEKIPTLNRVQLIADAADLSYVGSLKYDVFFNLLGYLKHEDKYLPWKTALGKADTLKNHLRTNPTYGIFKSYMKSLLAPMYEKMGGLVMNNEENFDKLDQIKFHVLIASRSCKYGVEKCIDDAKALFKKLQESPEEPNPIPKDLRGMVYCTALKYGTENEWNFLWHRYQQSNVATEKSELLNILGCSKEIWILSRYLAWSLDETKIRRQDSSSVFSSVASNEVGYYIAKKFFFDNVENIFKHLAPNTRRISRYLSVIAGQMQEAQELDELYHLIHENKEHFSGVKQGAEQALETVKIRIQWQQKHSKEMHKVLQKYAKSEIN